MIEKTIVPELHVLAGRLRALQDVPPEHQQLIAEAQTFLTLRDESWQLLFHRLRVPLPIEEARVRSEGPLR